MILSRRPAWLQVGRRRTVKKPRRVCAAHGANKVQSVFSGGKWMRLQERKARLAKSNPCSAYVGKNSSRPASRVRLQLCKLRAAQLVKSNPCSAVEFLCRRRRNYARSRVQLLQTRAQRSGSRLRAWQNTFLPRSGGNKGFLFAGFSVIMEPGYYRAILRRKNLCARL